MGLLQHSSPVCLISGAEPWSRISYVNIIVNEFLFIYFFLSQAFSLTLNLIPVSRIIISRADLGPTLQPLSGSTLTALPLVKLRSTVRCHQLYTAPGSSFYHSWVQLTHLTKTVCMVSSLPNPTAKRTMLQFQFKRPPTENKSFQSSFCSP